MKFTNFFHIRIKRYTYKFISHFRIILVNHFGSMYQFAMMTNHRLTLSLVLELRVYIAKYKYFLRINISSLIKKNE